MGTCRRPPKHCNECDCCLRIPILACLLAQQGRELQRVNERLQNDAYDPPSRDIINLMPPEQAMMVLGNDEWTMVNGQWTRRVPSSTEPAAAGGLQRQGRQILLN